MIATVLTDHRPGHFRTSRSRRHMAAISLSAIAHVLLLSLFFSAAGNSEPELQGNEGSEAYIEISLIGRPGSNAESRSPPTVDTLNALLQQVQQEQSVVQVDEAVRAHNSLDELFRDIAPGRAQEQQGPDGTGIDSAVDPQSAPRKAPRASKAANQKLWGLVKPCWDKLGGSGGSPAFLEVTLSTTGLIDAPPVILREDGAPPEPPRLLAEARALAALRGCLPYSSLKASTPRSFKLDFSELAAKGSKAR